MQEPSYSNHRRASYNKSPFYNITHKNEREDYTEYLVEYKDKYHCQIKKPWIYLTLKKTVIRPTSGWKIHISATFEDRITVLKCVTKYCIDHELNFKMLDCDDTFRLFNSKEIGRPSAGKFIVIYLPEVNCQHVFDDLHELLKDFNGPYILSDKPYKASRSIYYRYGEFWPIAILNERGTSESFFIGSDKNLMVDKRVPFYSLPDGVEDLGLSVDIDDDSKLLKKYEPLKSLSFSGAGGVYLMRSKADDKKYVVKETRAFTGLDIHNAYASERLENEYKMLQLIEKDAIGPKPIEFMMDCNNCYLVEEYLEGISLVDYILKNNPLMRPNSTQEIKDAYIATCQKIIDNILSIMKILEEHSLVIQDLSYNNFIVDEESLSLKIIDFEFCKEINGENIAKAYTPGFKTYGYGERQAENIKLSKLFLAMLFPNNSIYDNHQNKVEEFCQIYKSIYDHEYVDRLVTAILMNFERVCTISEIEQVLSSSHQKVDNEINVLKPSENVLDYYDFILKNFNIPKPNAMYFFPSDPHLFNTNMYSVAHGAFGVLYALSKIKSTKTFEKITEDVVLKSVSSLFYLDNKIPVGLMMGYAGIGWSLLELGYHDIAIKLYDQKVLYRVPEDHGYFYGKAGVLMTSLKFYLEVGHQKYLDHSIALFKALEACDSNKFDINTFGNGKSGIALALLYLYRITQDEKHLNLGLEFLNHELEQLSEINGVVGINRSRVDDEKVVHSPYIYDGISGVGTTVLRYYKVTKDEKLLNVLYRIIDACHYEMTLFATYMRGMSGVISFLTDCKLFLDKKDPVQEKCDAYIQKLIHHIGLHQFSDKDTDRQYFLGEQLFKASLDYTAGTSGIILQLDYYNKSKMDEALNPNFFLDEIL